MSPIQCAFIQTRACPIGMDKIPVDVCRLCIDAWKTSAEIQKLTGANIFGQTIIVPTRPEALQMIPSALKNEPITPVPIIQGKIITNTTQELFNELDNNFINDQISTDEYIKKRRQLVNQLRACTTIPT